MQKITPFLWFNDNADEAINFYTSIFKDSSVSDVMRYGEAGPGPEGTIMSATFKLAGQEFIALNGGPMFHFTEAISLFVRCDNQDEVDYYWEKLTAGGQESRCGWLRDKFGLSWQIVPNKLGELLQSKDREKANRAMQAMMQMSKIEIAKLEQA
jgi:predicted 3-demethylubiquinone-9 3-methyltransferase (glyoxalase superfamily)